MFTVAIFSFEILYLWVCRSRKYQLPVTKETADSSPFNLSSWIWSAFLEAEKWGVDRRKKVIFVLVGRWYFGSFWVISGSWKSMTFVVIFSSILSLQFIHNGFIFLLDNVINIMLIFVFLSICSALLAWNYWARPRFLNKWVSTSADVRSVRMLRLFFRIEGLLPFSLFFMKMF